MKVYISGKITGLPIKEVRTKFNAAQNFCEIYAQEIVNPMEINKISKKKTWIDYMIRDIKALETCDAIFMLKDWGQSKGARIEYEIAKELGLKIMFE